MLTIVIRMSFKNVIVVCNYEERKITCELKREVLEEHSEVWRNNRLRKVDTGITIDVLPDLAALFLNQGRLLKGEINILESGVKLIIKVPPSDKVMFALCQICQYFKMEAYLYKAISMPDMTGKPIWRNYVDCIDADSDKQLREYIIDIVVTYSKTVSPFEILKQIKIDEKVGISKQIINWFIEKEEKSPIHTYKLLIFTKFNSIYDQTTCRKIAVVPLNEIIPVQITSPDHLENATVENKSEYRQWAFTDDDGYISKSGFKFNLQLYGHTELYYAEISEKLKNNKIRYYITTKAEKVQHMYIIY